jgi:hypothetical protein
MIEQGVLYNKNGLLSQAVTCTLLADGTFKVDQNYKNNWIIENASANRYEKTGLSFAKFIYLASAMILPL